VLFGGVGGASATSLTACTVSISAPVANPTTAPASAPITYTATVTAGAGCTNGSPTGSVNFYSNYVVGGLPQVFQLGTSTSVVATSTPGQSVATMVDSSLPMGSFVITATFNSSNTALFLNSGTSAGTNVVISSSAPPQTSMNFTESDATIPVGQPVTFDVHINVLDQNGQVTNAIATGLVDFSAGSAGGSGQFHFATVQLDSTGSLSFTYQGFVPGDYIVTASYLGSPSSSPISGQLELHVLAPQSTATTTTVSASPSSFSSGDSTTFTATVTEAGGAPVPAGGTVTFSAGPTATSLTSEGEAQTDANGVAQLSAQNFLPGSYVVVARYTGDSANSIASSTSVASQFFVSTSAVTGTAVDQISYTGDTSAAFGSTATLSAHLQDGGGGAIGGKTITLSAGAQSCTTTSDAQGNASCQIVVTQNPAQYAATASFGGDGNWEPAAASGPFTVVPAPSSLQYTGDTSGAFGSTATLSATLTGAGAFLTGRNVTLTMGLQSCSATTDGSGNASCQITIAQSPGPYPVSASFAGDTDFTTSSASGNFTVTAPTATATTYTGATQGVQGSTVTLSATVTGVPNGATVAFVVGAESCNGTVATGAASCQVTLTDAPGSGYTVSATYAGDASHTGSADSKPFTVIAPTTATHIAAVGPVLAGSSATLSATVSPSSAPGTVTFSSGGTTLCTATLSAGAASCSASFAQTGTYTVTAKYGGNGLYPPSSDSTSVLVYALAPGGGSFVVGDKSATGNVTFWGAQWSKVNALSGGPAPDAFKGFALNGATCGGTWTTDPGNSSPPPAGPLPAYMAVLVTSASAKAGSMIYGNTVAIVIVQTSAGYKNDPGHAGTGTVVATLCTGSGALTKPATKTTYTGATSGATGAAATLSATLTDAAGNALNNETVTLSVGTLSCTGKTDGKGNASCNVTITQGAGSYPVTATFAGDAGYAGSNASSTFTVAAASVCSTKGSKCESLLADPTVTGRTLTLVYMDDSTIKSATATANGQSLPVAITATSGQPQNYVDSNGGSTSTKNQSRLTITLPAAGTYSVVVTAYDSDGDLDQYVWTVTVP